MGWIKYKKSSVVTETDEGTYMISVSDLMTGLLTIFILTLIYYILNFSQATAQLTDNNIKRAAILNSIKEDLMKQGIEVKIDTAHGVLHLPEGILFDVGEAQVKDKGLTLVQVLGPVLNDTINKPEYAGSIETIFIEGHTDNVPIKTDIYASNWELSTQRAINTWNAITKAAPGLLELKNTQNQYIFSCSGYADTRPISTNDTIEGRQENRRIDLRFSMTPPSKDEINIIKQIKRDLAQ